MSVIRACEECGGLGQIESGGVVLCSPCFYDNLDVSGNPQTLPEPWVPPAGQVIYVDFKRRKRRRI